MNEQLAEFVGMLAVAWPVWLVSVVLVVAAVIDARELRVPNWLTFPLIISGWAFSAVCHSWFGYTSPWEGFVWSLVGTGVGLALLLPAYAIGGMGAGDVKLLAGVGAWMHGTHTFYAFCISAVVGAVIAVGMIAWQKKLKKHFSQMWMIVGEVLTIRNPSELAAIAADRKSSMLLLPYGIPIAIGTIGYFLWMGMFTGA